MMDMTLLKYLSVQTVPRIFEARSDMALLTSVLCIAPAQSPCALRNL